jgi:hypothetical protein
MVISGVRGRTPTSEYIAHCALPVAELSDNVLRTRLTNISRCVDLLSVTTGRVAESVSRVPGAPISSQLTAHWLRLVRRWFRASCWCSPARSLTDQQPARFSHILSSSQSPKEPVSDCEHAYLSMTTVQWGAGCVLRVCPYVCVLALCRSRCLTLLPFVSQLMHPSHTHLLFI